MFLLEAFGDRESTAGGWVDLGAAVTLPSLELVIDDTHRGKGAVAWGWDESAVVVLGSGMSGLWEWRRSARRRWSCVLSASERKNESSQVLSSAMVNDDELTSVFGSRPGYCS